MGKLHLTVSGLHFQYEQSPETLFSDLGFAVQSGWTGIIGGNGAGKTTLLKLVTGLLTPQAGSLVVPGRRLYCRQGTDAPPPGLEDFYQALYDGDSDAGRLFGLLRLDHDWPYRWDTLSHGERKRAQLAAALQTLPELLALDEPTNHLDAAGQRILLDGLSGFKGIGLLVSHDRGFLDRLCGGYLFVSGGNALYRPGPLADCLEQERRENAAALREYDIRRKNWQRLKRETQSRRETADRHRSDVSKKGIGKHDSDARARINGIKNTGRDAIGDKLTKTMKLRADKAGAEMTAVTKPGFRKSGVSLNGLETRRDFLMRMEPGRLPLGELRNLTYPELVIRPGDRIALTGDNGSGKSTLISRMFSSGGIRTGETLYLPQEISAADRDRLQNLCQELSDSDRGMLLSHYYRLNGNPRIIEETGTLSPGELRKLTLASGFFDECSLIILDEPTNHLDLPSRQAMEETLAVFSGALLLVSHDGVFRNRLCREEWSIGKNILRIKPLQG
jgi:ATPase subunit of ABC transporter with duplicated ATPase domains